MDDIHFSLRDTLQATLGPCLPCLKPSSSSVTDNGVLDGLLQDPGSGGETMSLHSSFGADRRKRKKKASNKHMTLFGWDVFGKRPAIQLEGDDQDQLAPPQPARRANATPSSSSGDADASPLDIAEIARMDQERLAAREAAIAAEDARLKQERRELRRAKREMTRALMEFEESKSQFYEHQLYLQQQQQQQQQQQAPVTAAPPPPKPKLDLGGLLRSIGFKDNADDDEEETGDADFGGQSYSRRPPPSGSRSNGSGHSRSDSRSRTSASGAPYYTNAHSISPHLVPLPRSEPGREVRSPLSNESSMPIPPTQPRRKTKSSTSNRSSSTSQSISLPSPHGLQNNNARVASPLVHNFEGYPDDEFEGFPADEDGFTAKDV